MSQTTYFVPVPFVRFQDPTSRSDAPTGGNSNPGAAGSAGTGEPTGPKQDPNAAPQGPCANDTMLWMMPVFLVLMYFMMIRPEQKRKKEQQALLSSIKQGDKVVTISGMHGVVDSLTEKTVTLRVDSINMTFDRTAVARVEREPAADNAAPKAS
jgi:preprotein translocase subunit YajC